jgi:hypothetical protein
LFIGCNILNISNSIEDYLKSKKKEKMPEEKTRDDEIISEIINSWGKQQNHL